MNVTTATITKIITSHFAISIVKPAIPFMPMIKNTRARNKEDYEDRLNQPFFTSPFFFFNSDPALCAAILASASFVDTDFYII